MRDLHILHGKEEKALSHVDLMGRKTGVVDSVDIKYTGDDT